MRKIEVQLKICALLCCHVLMFNRNITNEFLSVAKDYPVVTVLGPRQAGKATLAKQVFVVILIVT